MKTISIPLCLVALAFGLTPAPAQEPAPSQDTAQLIEKDILAAYDEEKPAQPLPADTDFRSEFKLDLDELKFGRNYEPDK